MYAVRSRYVLGFDGRDGCGDLPGLFGRRVFVDGGERVYHLFGGRVFTGWVDRVYHLFIRFIFTGGRECVYQLFCRRVFTGWVDRVYHLFTGFIVTGRGERVCELFRRRVFGRDRSEQREYVCAMPHRCVLERLRRECLRVMPDWIKLLHTGIHIHHKLRLQRRVLRTERRRVRAMPGPIVL